MSVCFFDVQELANVANVIAQGAHDRAESICRSAPLLALISKANAACFKARYGHKGNADARPVSAAEIVAGCARVTRADLPMALHSAGLFSYNCDDEGGDQLKKTRGGYAALASILGSLAHVAADEIQASRNARKVGAL